MDKYRYNHLLFLQTLKHEKEENGQCLKTSRDYFRAHQLFLAGVQSVGSAEG